MPDLATSPSFVPAVPQTAMNPLGYADPFSTVPPGYVKTGDGRIVRAQSAESVMVNRDRKKMLLCFLYWEGDLERVDALANLVADLERVNNPNVDVLLFGRMDCRAGLQYSTIERLRGKFGTVHLMTDGGNYAVGFPWAANVMWEELATRMAAPVWADRYRCFLNLEWDCVPTRPGWLNELGREFDQAALEGFAVIGARQTDPMLHFNGVAVYANDLTRRVAGIDGSCPPDAAYDIYYAPKINPVGMNTPKIKLDYRRATITPDELFASPACLYHGVRDLSAMAAVRDTHINHIPRGEQAFTRKTVFTYHRKISGVDEREVADQLSLWQRGWLSAGWNPVTLTARVAEQHPLYAEVMARVASFPTTAQIEHINAKWESFLALAVQGGGVLADFDVLPSGALTPNSIPARAGFQNLAGGETGGGCLVQADKAGADAFVAAILAYEPPAKATNVQPCDIMAAAFDGKSAEPDANLVRDQGESGWRAAKAVHFHAKAIAKSLPGFTSSRAMISYLRGE